jgi:hypothetical protein
VRVEVQPNDRRCEHLGSQPSTTAYRWQELRSPAFGRMDTAWGRVRDRDYTLINSIAGQGPASRDNGGRDDAQRGALP